LVRAGGAYLLVAILVWWHVWSTHPTGVAPCGCSDPAFVTWFLAWPAHALLHGLNPFYSSQVFHPVGINLLSNASSLALGVLLAPVTWLFGPVATLNAAATLVPALSALAMYWLLLRWVRWAPAAFVGGLIYGFSPFVLTALAISHLMTGALMLPPLILACLDELLVRQQRRPLRVGLVLGLLIVVQFFLGTELLTIMALSGAVGLVLLGAYGLATEGRSLARRLPHAIRGLVGATAVAVAGLAYPAWFALEGPAHLSGQLWGKAQSGSADSLSTYVSSVWAALPHSAVRALQIGAVFGGYVGRPLPAPTYLGPGVVLVIVAGLCVWRKDRRLWFFGAFGLISFVLSIAPHEGSIWVPWNVLANVPVVEDIIAGRFMVITILCAAVVVAIVVDRTYHAVGRMGDHSRLSAGSVTYLATVAGLAVALVAVGPIAEAESSALPLAVQPVVVPRFFSPTTPNHPGGNAVVLAYPFPGESAGPVMIWQAIDGMSFAIAGGGGPEGIVSRAGPEMAGYVALQTDSFSFVWAEATAANDQAVRNALAGWGVTTIVIPAPNSVPLGEHGWGASVLGAVGLITGALGRQPAIVDHALVWTDVQSPTPSVVVSGTAFKRCAAMGASSASSLSAESRCILAARP
jgi:hypothetical protein